MLRRVFRNLPRLSRGQQFSTAGSWGEVLNGTVASSPDTVANKARMDELVTELGGIVGKIHMGGGEKAQARHRSRGKMTARDRINGLVDPGSPFLEVGTLAAYDMYDDWIPSAGIVTGIGKVKGYVLC